MEKALSFFEIGGPELTVVKYIYIILSFLLKAFKDKYANVYDEMSCHQNQL